jgi:hypothetical protein
VLEEFVVIVVVIKISSTNVKTILVLKSISPIIFQKKAHP